MKQLQPILEKYIVPVVNRPSIFSEFLDEPHLCTFTLPGRRNFKTSCSVVSVEEFVEYYETVARSEEFQCNWMHGREFDSYQDNTDKDRNWWYAIVDSAMMQQKSVRNY